MTLLAAANLGTALALSILGCGALAPPTLPPENTDAVDMQRYRLLTRFVHITDAHVLDEESPARLALFAGVSGTAWRPQEAYTAQVLDGTLRAVNKLHVARHAFDFLIHTGDAVDNAQLNELRWFMEVFAGGVVDPLSGVDDRRADHRPDPLLDPHAPFVAQGLYRRGVHGDAPTIPWYSLVGNHDRFALGVFPIVENLFGVRVAPLQLEPRLGLFAPTHLNPIVGISWAPISPANSGPLFGLTVPRRVPANPDRRYFTELEFVQAHLSSGGSPPGHGFDPADPERTWYSVSPVPGLRLIGLNTSAAAVEVVGLIYVEGTISRPQREFLVRELESAQAADEVVIVATHHPSISLDPTLGTSLSSRGFRELLDRYPNVALHLAGHWHTEHVFDAGGYVEIVTGSLIDAPQRGRIIELWRRDPAVPSGGGNDVGKDEIELRYRFFAHYDAIEPTDDAHADLFDDPLAELRRMAARLAGVDVPVGAD